MTYLTASRDALAEVLVENDPDPCDPIEYDAGAYYRDFADALIASGAVIPVATLADDEALRLTVGKAATDAVDDIPYDRDDYSDTYTHRVAGVATLRALSAALTERKPVMFHSAENGLPATGATDAQVEAAARAIHAHQEYSTCWDDEQAGSLSRTGTKMRPLGEHGRTFYRGLARAALSAVIPPGKDQ